MLPDECHQGICAAIHRQPIHCSRGLNHRDKLICFGKAFRLRRLPASRFASVVRRHLTCIPLTSGAETRATLDSVRHSHTSYVFSTGHFSGYHSNLLHSGSQVHRERFLYGLCEDFCPVLRVTYVVDG